MQEIKPPARNIKYDSHLYKKVFLAGSIEMGNDENWQALIPQEFKDRENLIFFNPRRNDWDSTWEQDESNPHFNYHVNWELDKLEEADIIFMYFSPGTQSPISLLELGIFANSKKIIVCCPASFYRKGNVDIVCARFDIPLYVTLEHAIGRLRTELRNIK
jgi:hypothetical protein